MIRHCDGTDPNLTREARPGEEPRGPWPDSVPCDCGLEFDDTERMVLHPHLKFADISSPGLTLWQRQLLNAIWSGKRPVICGRRFGLGMLARLANPRTMKRPVPRREPTDIPDP